MSSKQVPELVASAQLWELFRTYQERPFVFVEPGGNAGDYLIYKGAEKLARLAGLDFTSVTHRDFMQRAYGAEVVIYLHGSGGYNPMWSGTPMLELEKAAVHKGVVIQGPATYWNDRDFLKERVVLPLLGTRCERLVLMAREQISYEALSAVVPPKVDCILDHDTALNLERADLEPILPERTGVYRYYAIREDKEAREVGNRAYFSAWCDPVRRGRNFEGWLRLHAEAKEIVTNRLHSSICGSILGIPTTLLPNSYFKNRAVWEHSLAERGVEWTDRVEVDAASTFVHHVGPARWLMRHPRIQRLVQLMNGMN